MLVERMFNDFIHWWDATHIREKVAETGSSLVNLDGYMLASNNSFLDDDVHLNVTANACLMDDGEQVDYDYINDFDDSVRAVDHDADEATNG